MKTTQYQISELFEQLPLAEKRGVAAELYERAVLGKIGPAKLTPEQQADLAIAIEQADRGELIPSADLKAAKRARFGFDDTRF